MNKLKIFFAIALCAFTISLAGAQKNKTYTLQSFDQLITLTVEVGEEIHWAVKHDGQQIIAPSAISLELMNGEVLGKNPIIYKTNTSQTDETFQTNLYKRKVVTDQYNQLSIQFEGNYSLTFRVYNDGIAYRFETQRKEELTIKNEEANFNFTADHNAFIPYMWDYRDDEKYVHSFEALYREQLISEFSTDSLAFLPLLVDVGNGKKAVVLEADLNDYPGMYLNMNDTKKGFMAEFAPYPVEFEMGGYNNMNEIPTKRAAYIAITEGTRTFPWRAVVISKHDKELLDNDMVQKLSPPCEIDDPSWITPGLTAWDWWNDWNISHVDFRAGYNTPTFKHYIDFAAENNLQYIVIDWGWSGKTDLFEMVVPELDVKEVIEYGSSKGIGVVLWTTWIAIRDQMDTAIKHYADMGAKGFKIDFIDRDDQLAVKSLYDIAQKAAEYKMLVDYHGVFKPTGLHRTYPNVVGYEGVKGLENFKWATEDQPRYTASIPFIRQMAGPMDYTPGAMRNATKEYYHPNNSMPMSMGTRCHQLAMYIIHEAPFQMLPDNPTTYRREQESTDFIAQIPTTSDETVALDGEVGEYAAIARQKDGVWYVGAMTNWTARELTINFSFLGEGKYKAEIFSDGINADRNATDYKKESLEISADRKITINMAPGGGWAAQLERIE
jgi:alpha-glucosidase